MGIFGIGKKDKEKDSKKVDSKPKEEKIDVSEKLEQGYVLFRTIIEVLGSPKEYVDETIHKYLEKVDNDSGFNVMKTDFSEPKEHDEGVFGVFVEAEILAKSIDHISAFCFDYMPSSVEIIEPEKLIVSNGVLSDFFNDLQARLHKLDLLAKQLNMENKNLKTNAGALLRNLIMNSLKEGAKNVEDISKFVGIPIDQIKPFLEKRIAEGYIELKDDIYCLKKK